MNAFKEDNPKRHPSGSMESPSHPRDGQTRADWAKAVAPRDPVCFPPSKSIGVSMPSADHTRSTGEPGGKTGETGGFDRPSHGGRGSRWRMWHGMREVFPGVPSPSQQEFFFFGVPCVLPKGGNMIQDDQHEPWMSISLESEDT